MGPRWARRRRSGGGSALLLLLGHCWLWAAGADDNGSQLSYYTALINVTVLSPERGGPTLLRIDRGRYGQDSPKVEVKGLLVTPVPINGGNGPAPRRVGVRGGGRERRGRNVPEGERQSRAPGRGCGCAVCVCVCRGCLPSCPSEPLPAAVGPLLACPPLRAARSVLLSAGRRFHASCAGAECG